MGMTCLGSVSGEPERAVSEVRGGLGTVSSQLDSLI